MNVVSKIPGIPGKSRFWFRGFDAFENPGNLTCLFWNVEWADRKDCRQTHHFFPELNVKLAKQITRCDRRSMSSLVQFLTGHNFMARHEAIVHLGRDQLEGNADCRFCQTGLEESSYHIFAECETFADKRQRWFGLRELNLPFPQQILTVSTLMGFLRDIDIKCMLYDIDDEDDPVERLEERT